MGVDEANAERFTFFWSHREDAPHAECSQFYRRSITIERATFNCCEQWLHWRKALLFSDRTAAQAILAEFDPREQKRLGRQVENFSEPVWGAVARDIAFRGNIAKFSQHPDLLERLRATAGTLLVEASPLDRIWGIGLSQNDPRAAQRDTWQGTNWLGDVLTDVRRALCGS